MANNSFHFKVEAEVPQNEAAQYFQNMVQATSQYFQPGEYRQVEDKKDEPDEQVEVSHYTVADWQEQLMQNLRRTDLIHISLDPYGNTHRRERSVVRSAMRGGGAFTVNSESGERRYTIVFMEEGPPLRMNDGTSAPNLPFCSCRAFRYRSYDSRNENHNQGGCKHLRDVYDFADTNEDFSSVNWNFRPEDSSLDPWSFSTR
jgi:hypothetical protein